MCNIIYLQQVTICIFTRCKSNDFEQEKFKV